MVFRKRSTICIPLRGGWKKGSSKGFLYPDLIAFLSLVALFSSAALIFLQHPGANELKAYPMDYRLKDQDKDLLPDSLEWVTLSNELSADTDKDGVGDFEEVVHFDLPNVFDKKGKLEKGFRVLSTLEPDPYVRQKKDLWIHCLFHFPAGKLEDLKAFSLFLDSGGIRYPLTGIMVSGFRELKTKKDPRRGLFVRISYCFSVSPSIIPANFAISGVSILGAKVYRAGTLIVKEGGSFLTLVKADPKRLAFQTAGRFETTNPFWSKNRVCVFKLDTQAIGRLGVLCEVVSSSCQVATRFKCAPNCKKMKGLTFVLPDGLGAITGG